MGLGAGSLSFVYELPVDGFFNYYLPSRDCEVSGSLVLIREAILVSTIWVPMLSSIKNPSFYYLWLTSLGVGGIQVPIFEDVFQLIELSDGGVNCFTNNLKKKNCNNLKWRNHCNNLIPTIFAIYCNKNLELIAYSYEVFIAITWYKLFYNLL